MSDDPRGKTLWEMFVDWVRGESTPAPSPDTELGRPADPVPDQPNPLGWEVGAAVQLSPDNGDAFREPLTVLGIWDVARSVKGVAFRFVDYLLEAPNGNKLRLRCLSDSGGESRLILENVDTFACEPGFLDVVNDDTGFFDITNDDTGETDRFQRLNDVRGPYQALIRDGEKLTRIDYWDWARTCNDGSEEFVFVEHYKPRDEIEIWRGWRLID